MIYLLTTLILYGSILPYLISAAHTELVVLGLVLWIAHVYHTVTIIMEKLKHD